MEEVPPGPGYDQVQVCVVDVDAHSAACANGEGVDELGFFTKQTHLEASPRFKFSTWGAKSRNAHRNSMNANINEQGSLTMGRGQSDFFA